MFDDVHANVTQNEFSQSTTDQVTQVIHQRR